ncbi:MAG: aminotransferase class I/II-fold pyridoxal phosphate-dependent enzyme [Novosphingobium sp.]
MNSPWTWHGGGLAAARAHFGDGPHPWLDLSTGINPHAWPGASDMAIEWRRLPEEADLRALEEAAAAHFGTDPDHVCALPGTEIGLRLTGGILPGPARYIAPSYRTHGEIFDEATPVARDKLAIAGDATVILANPNNPDGRITERSTLIAMLERQDRAAWLILDEAFADADPAHSMAPYIADDRRMIVFRSFGKFFGLAGLRLGFLLGPRPVIAKMRRKLGAWPVSAATIAIGTAAYRDRGWIDGMRARLFVEAQALDAALANSGHDPVGDCPLFRLIETGDAQALFERLARQAILARPFDYEPRWLRFGLPGSEAGLARLASALRHG